MTNDKQLAKAEPQTGIVMPKVTGQQALEAWKAYEDLKRQILTPDDIQKIQGKDFKKKSFWRKCATFFNINLEVLEEKKESLGKTMVWHFTVRATDPVTGRFADGVGSCDCYEKATLVDGKYLSFGKPATPNSIHNTRSTAETRATNRAISNLVGGGEVSAEEVDQGQVVHEAQVVDEELATEKQLKMLHMQLTRTGNDKEKIFEKYDIVSTSQLSKKQCSALIDALLKKPDAQTNAK